MQSFGILIGSNKNSEWMLPLFWLSYRLHNAYPIAIADFGMSPAAKDWCLERMRVISLPSDTLTTLNKLHPFFKKPHAFLASPFEKTLWLDMDCMVRGSLSPLEQLKLPSSGFALLQEETIMKTGHHLHFENADDMPLFNSGVVLFDKSSPLLKLWAEKSLSVSHLYCGDQEILSHLIFSNQIPVANISHYYNWIPCLFGAPTSETKILHCTGEVGKLFIHRHKKAFEKHIGHEDPLPRFSNIDLSLSKPLKKRMDEHGMQRYYRSR